MKNKNEIQDDKPKGNMIQNENREDEAVAPDSTIVENKNVVKPENIQTQEQREKEQESKFDQNK